MVAGKYSESLEVSNRALDLLQKGSPRATALLTKVDALLMLDRLDEALPLVDEAWRAAQGKNTEQFAQIFTRIGRPKRTKEVLQSAIVTPNNRLYFALGYESLGEIGTVFELIRDGIQDHDVSMLEVMRTNIWSDPVKQDPRFLNMLDLLESKETNTPKYLRAHDASSVQSS